MLLDDDDGMWRGVDDYWISRVISPALLDAARGDRSLWADMGPRISGFASNALVGTRAWAAAQPFWHQKSSRPGGSLASHQDIGDFYPGPAQLMTALDQHVQRPGAAMWSVVPYKVRSAWRDHVDAVKSFAYEAYFGRGIKGTGLDELNEEHRRLIVQQLVAPLHVAELDGELRRGMLAANAWTPKNPPDDIVEAFIEPWCDRLARRQSHYLETIAVAYADPKSPVFAHHPRLRDKLHQMRALLLEHPARHQVDQRDVIDPEYRAALFDATVTDQLKAPTSPSATAEPASLGETDAEPAPPEPPQGGAPFVSLAEATPSNGNGGGGGDGLALGLGMLGLLWTLRGTKRRRRRRRA